MLHPNVTSSLALQEKLKGQISRFDSVEDLASVLPKGVMRADLERYGSLTLALSDRKLNMMTNLNLLPKLQRHPVRASSLDEHDSIWYHFRMQGVEVLL